MDEKVEVTRTEVAFVHIGITELIYGSWGSKPLFIELNATCTRKDRRQAPRRY
jgi:hypothetical protein